MSSRRVLSDDLKTLEFETSEDVEVTPTFDSMVLREELIRGVYAYGFEKPSAIQQRSIKPIVKGRDNKNRVTIKKVGQLRTPTKYPTDASASARQIMKLERSVSPTNGRPTIPTSQYETFKSQVESSTPVRPTRRGVSPQRAAKEGSFIPQRSKSPTRASMERERPKSTTELTKMSLDSRLSMDENGDNSTFPLKSAMKETKIPVLKKTGVTQLSKSSEDICKMKKKSAFKDQLRNIFGRKKKKSKLYNNGYDPDEEYRNHVTIVTEQSFQHMDDVMNFPLSRERRSNSTSQILRSYTFESDDDDDYNNDDDGDPISAV